MRVKLSVIDSIGSFYPKKMKNNFLQYYRLFTFHFLHINITHLLMNIFSLISYCSFFEVVIKKSYFIALLFLSGTLSAISCIKFFEENERYCGINADLSGIFGAFIMLFIMNWEETLSLFGPKGRLLTPYLVSLYAFLNFLFCQFNQFGNLAVQLFGFIYGALLFGLFFKPIKNEKWKIFVRIGCGIFIFMMTLTSLIYFYLKV